VRIVNAPARRLLVSAALAATVDPRALVAQDSIPATDKYSAVARNLTSLIERERAQKGVPGISIALVDGQRVVWARGFGWADSSGKTPATASTVYRVGSISKLLLDVAIVELAQQHKLDLDAPVQRALPSFHPRNPFGGDITIRELMAYRSGLTREPPVGNYFDDDSTHARTLAATVASLNSTTLVSQPGTRATYSNAAIAVLGDVLERTQKEPFASYLDRAGLKPIGMDHSAFGPTPEMSASLAKGTMWTIDGRRFDAPTFQLGTEPLNLYTNVLDLGKLVEALFARGATSSDGGRLNGHRTVGHSGAIYGFASRLLALPEDSLGVVVVATLDGANGVTNHVADAAARMLLEVRGDGEPHEADSTIALPPSRAIALMGRYVGKTTTVDLDEFEGGLYATALNAGVRLELRVPENGAPGDLITDDRLVYGRRLRALDGGRLVVGNDTLRRIPTPTSDIVAIQTPKPPAAKAEFGSLIGEYGHDYDVLYIREKDGKLNALIGWFFEYPLERLSRNVYRFPKWGLYDGEQVVFERNAKGMVTAATAGNVRYKRRPLPADNDLVNFKIAPVRPVAELRREALAATPPREPASVKSPDLVELRSLDPTIKYDIRYATANNFMGTPFYSSAHAFMQRDAAEAVVRAAAELRKLGYGLLIHDSYRPWYVTKMFWDGTPPDKHVFVADPSRGSRHNRGAAVDLTLYDLKSGAPIRMTGGYDEFSDRSYPLYPGGTTLQRWSRDFLRHAMEAQGFTVYEAEWWHFDYKDWKSYPIGNLTFEQLAAGHR